MGLLALTAGLAAPSAASGFEESARIVLAWAARPLEVRAVVDRPVDAAFAGRFVGSTVHFDTHLRNRQVWRGSGPPAFRPPLGSLKIVAARLDESRRELILTTDPHSREALYSAEIPAAAGPLRLEYDLTGVEASWSSRPDGGEPAWTGWWPALDPEESRRLTGASPNHRRGFELMAAPGRLTIETMLVVPEGTSTVVVTAGGMLESTLGGEAPTSRTAAGAEFAVAASGEPSLLSLAVQTGAPGALPGVRVGFRKEGEETLAQAGPERCLVAWVPPPVTAARAEPPEFSLEGGDPARGEAVFYGERARCSQCHKVGARGGDVGPDLSDRAGTPALDVYRDIAEPSASIHPDYTAYIVATKDGQVVAGVVRAEDAETVRVTDTDAKTTRIRLAEIEELRPSGTSIMPVGLVGAIGEEQVRDLVAFLTARRAQNNPSSGSKP
jgi:putative heme-binding domain-containing protein